MSFIGEALEATANTQSQCLRLQPEQVYHDRHTKRVAVTETDDRYIQCAIQEADKGSGTSFKEISSFFSASSKQKYPTHLVARSGNPRPVTTMLGSKSKNLSSLSIDRTHEDRVRSAAQLRFGNSADQEAKVPQSTEYACLSSDNDVW